MKTANQSPTKDQEASREGERKKQSIGLALAPALDPEEPGIIDINENEQPTPNINNNTATESSPVQPRQQEQYEEGKEEDASTLFAIDNAICVLNPEERRRQRLEQQLRNAPLVEGRPVVPQIREDIGGEAKKNSSGRRLCALLIFLVVVVAVVVLSVVITRQKKARQQNASTRDENNNNVTSNPTVVPSWSPSFEPSFLPTTNAPTSTTFANLVSLLGLDTDTLELDPNHYVFRSIQWMAEQDQISPLFLQQQASIFNDTNGTHLQLLQETALQRFALVSLFYATEGESWFDDLGFLNTTTHECEWEVFGRKQNLNSSTITCVNNIVTEIALSDNNLGGMIPNEVGLLTQLIWLQLHSNRIAGSIPSGLTTLDNLAYLLVGLNALTGSIPESIGSLANLRVIWLSVNFLTGSIPSSIQNLTLLQFLDLSFNMLTSTLPTEINSLQNLALYSASANMLTGTLPFEALSNPSLAQFLCVRNDLTGNMFRLAHLSSSRFLALDDNKVTGSIPMELCSIPQLVQLSGTGNELTGTLPDCLGNHTLLHSISFAENYLTGTIPTLSPPLEDLSLYGNRFTGMIPTGPTSLTSMALSFNNFTSGTLPTELTNLTNLEVLHLQGLGITGTIHTEMGSLTKLFGLNLDNNKLNGTIPSEVGLLRDLRQLILHENYLTGMIPTEILGLESLQTLFLHENMLTGTLPMTLFGNLPVSTFRDLTLYNNSLTGNVELFCENWTIGRFLADCKQLSRCSCCTGCCDVDFVSGSCRDFSNNPRLIVRATRTIEIPVEVFIPPNRTF